MEYETAIKFAAVQRAALVYAVNEVDLWTERYVMAAVQLRPSNAKLPLKQFCRLCWVQLSWNLFMNCPKINTSGELVQLMYEI